MKTANNHVVRSLPMRLTCVVVENTVGFDGTNVRRFVFCMQVARAPQCCW